MITRYNQDGSYYKITSDRPGAESIQSDVLSLAINEEQGKAATGSITVRDDSQGYNKILSLRSAITIEWGFKDPLRSLQSLLPDVRNSTEILGPPFRKGFKAVCLSPKGAGDAAGNGTYTINFRQAFGSDISKKTRNFPLGTRGTVVLQVLAELGVSAPFVLFASMGEPVTPDKPIKQTNETDFAFLARKAREWRVFFKISNTPLGTLAASFCDPPSILISPFKTTVTGSTGLSHLFGYRDSIQNVIDFEWEHNEAEDGTGDSLQFIVVNQQPVGISTTAAREIVLIRKLDSEKLKHDMEAANARGGPQAAADLYLSIVTAPNFQDPAVQRYWSPAEASTAPTGGGFRVSMTTFGNPLYLPGNYCFFSKGFPETIQNNENMKLSKVGHNLSKPGYQCKLEASTPQHIQR